MLEKLAFKPAFSCEVGPNPGVSEKTVPEEGAGLPGEVTCWLRGWDGPEVVG